MRNVTRGSTYRTGAVPHALSAVPLAFAVLILVCSACRGPDDVDALPDAASLLPVVENGSWGYVDRSGDVVIEPQFERAWPFVNELALVRSGGAYGYIVSDGSWAIEPRFTDAWHFAGGLAPVELDTAWGFVQRDGRVVGDTLFHILSGTLVEAHDPSPSLHPVTSGGRYGYRTTEGREVIDPQFENAWRFSEGLARVRSDGKWGYINREGTFAIEPRFDLAWDFQDGVAMVQVDGGMGYIDPSGGYIWSPRR